MFAARVYRERRERLKRSMESGLILLPGHGESPMNYPDNPYPFRQDSSSLYFYGLDSPGLAGVMDIEQDRDIVFGDDVTVDDIVWMGPQRPLKERCEQVGIEQTAPLDQLQGVVREALQQGRKIHFLPPYRTETVLRLGRLLDMDAAAVRDSVSEPLVKAVVAQRSVKSREEVEEIEAALEITYEMHMQAMRLAKPGTYEREVAGAMEGISLSRGGCLAFPTIFSTHGETLHNHFYGNKMEDGDIVVNDSGAESPSHYASDITRTFPVSGRFTDRQREIYGIVLRAQEGAMEAVRPGVEFRDIHRLACTIITTGLKDMGLMKGKVEDAVEAGAHALFFPCGVGHMLGLDVHDMESLGENYVGYTDTIRRNRDFGWRSLRLAKALEPGFVVTVEPGIYFIPELISRWKAEKRFADFIHYEKVDAYRDFGGVRIEDDVLVVEDGHRVLGRRIPKSVEEVEETCSL